MDDKLNYSLKNISDWELNSEKSDVKLPSLQRGLVWKPSQMELLWDSILRGFPIGSFVIEERGSEKFLLDGQQRSNAISCGFDNSIINNVYTEINTVLWLDICPPEVSTRKFWIKSTTAPHPWGYKNDDECNRLSSNERREALRKFRIDRNIYETTINLKETWPIEAGLPIPLSFIVNSISTSVDKNQYKTLLFEKLEQLYIVNRNYKDFFINDIEKNNDTLLNLYDELKGIKSYSIGMNVVKSEVIDRESESSPKNEKTDIEVLFERLGTGGTIISQSDLNYSTIKAYWGESVKSENEDIAKLYMSPEILISMAFRLVATISEDKKDGFSNNLSLKAIRKMANNGEQKEYLERLYVPFGNSPMRKIMEKVENWIIGIKAETGNYTPLIIRTAIARQYTDIYLLLISFAKRIIIGQEQSDINNDFFKALALHLFFFAKDLQKTANLIYKYCDGNNNITTANIKNALREAIFRMYLNKALAPEMIDSWDKIKLDYWDYYQEIATWGNDKTNYMLLYAQREYLNIRFKNYDPARSGYWEGHNRPWDLDHIIPKEWVVNKKSSSRDIAKSRLWNVGNCCAIPFEINRAKSNLSDWAEYEEFSEKLLFNEGFKEIDPNFIRTEEGVEKFGNIVLDRSIAIYKRFYADAVLPLMSDNIEFREDTILWKRKKLFEEVKGVLGAEASIYYVYEQSQKEITSLEDWATDWISIGVKLDDHLYACICANDMENIELGIRKHPKDKEIYNNYNPEILNAIGKEAKLQHSAPNDWWYLDIEISNKDFEIDKLKKLIEISKNILYESKNTTAL